MWHRRAQDGSLPASCAGVRREISMYRYVKKMYTYIYIYVLSIFIDMYVSHSLSARSSSLRVAS